MKRRFSRSTIRNRVSGFTLIEVLLALAIIMTLAAVSWTPLLTSWSEHRLKAAAEDVRSVLAGTRIRSLESDTIWQFRYEPGGDKYVRIPYKQTGEESNTLDGQMSLVLPEGLTFSEEDRLTTATREPLSAKDLEGLPNSSELNGVSWSASILFFPDGSATAVSFQVIDEQAGERTVSLRDLTGGVSVSRGNLDDEEL